MTDLQIAKDNLAGHTICLVKDGNCLYSELRGIAPMMHFIADNTDLAGYSAADLIVGKAAAMLFVKCGIKAVFAKTLSESGKRVLQEHGIAFAYETLTDKIINRAGTDLCPMEKALLNTCDVEEAYCILKNKLQAMSAKQSS